MLIASPNEADPKAIKQRRIFEGWSREAADRDVSLIQIVGAEVTGASDAAPDLRRRYGLEPGAFQVLLIGKDGRVALRSPRAISALELQGRIDAMPMRRAGER